VGKCNLYIHVTLFKYTEYKVGQSLISVWCFLGNCLFLVLFSFRHCIFSPFSIYGFWLSLNFVWYLVGWSHHSIYGFWLSLNFVWYLVGWSHHSIYGFWLSLSFVWYLVGWSHHSIYGFWLSLSFVWYLVGWSHHSKILTWLTFSEYLCYKWPRFITRVTRRVPLVKQDLLTLPEFIPVFTGFRVAPSLVFCVLFCRLLYVLFLLAIVLSMLLRFIASDYPVGILKLFLLKTGAIPHKFHIDHQLNFFFKSWTFTKLLINFSN
jgi:hypothetical protein